MTASEDYPREQARVRQLLSEYKAIGLSGAFAALMMEGVLEEADTAAMDGDIIKILSAYQNMTNCK